MNLETIMLCEKVSHKIPCNMIPFTRKAQNKQISGKIISSCLQPSFPRVQVLGGKWGMTANECGVSTGVMKML